MIREQSRQKVRGRGIDIVVIHLYAVAQVSEMSLRYALDAELAVRVHTRTVGEEMSVELSLVRYRILEDDNVLAVMELLREHRIHTGDRERERRYLVNLLRELSRGKTPVASYAELVNLLVGELYLIQAISPHSSCRS